MLAVNTPVITILPAWRYQLAITLARMSLVRLYGYGLNICRDEILNSINNLLDNGQYDDDMLIILDDHECYTCLELMALFLKVCTNLGYPQLSKDESKYLYTLDKLLYCLVCPMDLQALVNITTINHFDLYSDNDMVLSDDMLDTIYQFSYELDIYDSRQTHAWQYIAKLYDDFITDCQHWLANNEKFLTTALSKFAP